MTDKPETKKPEPTPRPPRQPDLSLITYLERGDEPEQEKESTESNSR